MNTDNATQENIVTVPKNLPLSLRDHFAGLVLQGLIAGGSESVSLVGDAAVAYRVADVMLKMREKSPEDIKEIMDAEIHAFDQEATKEHCCRASYHNHGRPALWGRFLIVID